MDRNELTEVAQTIREVLAETTEILDPAGLELDDNLFAAGLTSLDTVSAMVGIEKRLNIRFPAEDISRKSFESLRTIAQAALDARR